MSAAEDELPPRALDPVTADPEQLVGGRLTGYWPQFDLRLDEEVVCVEVGERSGTRYLHTRKGERSPVRIVVATALEDAEVFVDV